MKQAYDIFRKELDAIREAGTWREERIITTEQRARIDTTKAKGVLNMCANNYLGLANNPEIKRLLAIVNGYDGNREQTTACAQYIQELLKKYAASDGGELMQF